MSPLLLQSIPFTTIGSTSQTERVKNLLQYGRVGLSDPFLALQRDSIGGSVVRGGGVNEAELRALEETQLAQLEHLIAQQRKAHQRMRHVLREAEKVRGNCEGVRCGMSYVMRVMGQL